MAPYAILSWVRRLDNLAATEDDLKAMTALVRSALDAGAVGFSTSRILGHRSIQGEPVPGTFANDDEVMAIAEALRQSGKVSSRSSHQVRWAREEKDSKNTRASKMRSV